MSFKHFIELVLSYARFSSDNQDIKSAEDQEAENSIYAENHNMKIIKYFRDVAKSGTKTASRDGFFDMLHFCEEYNSNKDNKQKIKYILVWKFNRFARNDFDSSFYKNKLKKLGIKVLSITQPISDTPEGHLLEGIIESVDAYYSENLASDVRRAVRRKAKNCEFIGGFSPLGYKIVDKHFVIDEDEAKIVQEIFRLYIEERKGLLDIAITLNNKGYKTKMNKPFKQTSIYDILRNHNYIGTYKTHIKGTDETYEFKNAIPSIISKEDFDKVKEISKKRVVKSTTKKEVYLLSGLIKCTECGLIYTRK